MVKTIVPVTVDDDARVVVLVTFRTDELDRTEAVTVDTRVADVVVARALDEVVTRVLLVLAVVDVGLTVEVAPGPLLVAARVDVEALEAGDDVVAFEAEDDDAALETEDVDAALAVVDGAGLMMDVVAGVTDARVAVVEGPEVDVTGALVVVLRGEDEDDTAERVATVAWLLEREDDASVDADTRADEVLVTTCARVVVDATARELLAGVTVLVRETGRLVVVTLPCCLGCLSHRAY